MAHQQNIGYE